MSTEPPSPNEARAPESGLPDDQTADAVLREVRQLARDLEHQTEEAQTLAMELEEANQQLQINNLELRHANEVAEQSLAASVLSAERYRALVEASTLMVWSTDAAGQVTDMPFWREMTGQSVAEVRGHGWASAIHPEDAPRTMELWREAIATRTTFEAQYRVRLKDGSYRWYRARAVPLWNADGTVREWVGVFNEIDRLKRRDEGMRFLAEASAALTESLDERATLDTLARLAVDDLADGAMITLVRDDGTFEHVATRSRDPAIAAYAAETERLYPLPPDAPSGYPRAIRTGEPELIPEGAFDESILPDVAVDAVHLARLRHLQLYSGMVVPLVVRGTTLGAMTLVLHGTSSRRRPFDASDLALATELGRRAALAIDNSRLFAAEHAARAESERSAELTRRLQEITASFARAVTLDDVAAVTLSHGIDALSAHSGVMYRLNETGDAIDLVHQRGMADEGIGPYLHLTLDAHMPVTDALRAGEIIYLGERKSALERYPEAVAANRFVSADAWVAIPLFHAGVALGAVALGFTGDRTFSPEERTLVDALGRHCAQALERARLLEAERAARDDAVRANRAKSELLAKVSHETRQPVHATVGWTETLELGIHGPVTDAQREALRRIKQNQSRLLTVLNDLLDMSRIEAGKLDLRLEEIIVAEVMDVLEGTVGPQMREKGINYQVCHPGPDVRVRADRAQLVGILTNLLSNAGKFTRERGDVRVTCHQDEWWVLLGVEDSGIGIPADLRERVFEPFFQVETGFTRTTIGTGLGLSISREAARAMGGEVELESEVGRGSRFTVRLPRAGTRGK
jgi:PAS domain S-box-containing protein